MGVAALPDLRSVRRLLIIRLSSIGDVLHALPVSAALGEAFPNLELTWVVEEMSADMVLGNPYLHEVIVVPRTRWKKGRLRSPQVWKEYGAFLADLRRRQFDVTLDLQGYAKSALMALATGAPYRLGWGRLRDGAGLVSRALPRRPESVHRVDWFLDTARTLGAEPLMVRFPLAIPESAWARVTELLCQQSITPTAPFVVLNPAVGDERRRWGAARYAQLAVSLAEQCGLPSVLIGSGKDAPICEEVLARAQSERSRRSLPIEKTPPLVSLAGQTNLKELAAVLDLCAVHVCGDTGSAHIAAALGRPTVALYGPTDPAHAGPWGQEENVLSRRDLCGKECTAHQCGKLASPSQAGDSSDEDRTARCLQAITPEAALQKVRQALHGS